MVSVHELAEIEDDPEVEDLVSIPPKKLRREEPFEVVRCARCQGLHTVSARHARRKTMCRACSHGRTPTHIQEYYDFWLERFSMDEIVVMAVAIWGRKK